MAKKKNDDDLFVTSIKYIARTVFGWVGAVYMGWTIALLWGWFAVPYLGLPALTIFGGITISILVSIFFTPMFIKPFLAASITIDADPENSKFNSVFDWLGTPICVTVCLISGCVWHFFLFPVLIGLGLG